MEPAAAVVKLVPAVSVEYCRKNKPWWYKKIIGGRAFSPLTNRNPCAIIDSQTKRKELKPMKIIAVILTVACLCGVCALCADADIYAKTAIVYEIDRDADVVVVEDATGNLWEFEGVEDYEIGDFVSMVMDDNDTTSIYDDVIVASQYSGYSVER